MCQSDKYPNACGRRMTTLSEIALGVMYSTTVDRDSGHEEATVEGGSQSIEYGVSGTVVRVFWNGV